MSAAEIPAPRARRAAPSRETLVNAGLGLALLVFGIGAWLLDEPFLITLATKVAILAIAGAGMAKVRALWGGVLLVASAVGMFVAFGVNVFTLFPMGFCAVAGLMALAGAQPDEPKAHFQR